MQYKFISTQVHGIIDYAVGTMLTSAPVFGKSSPESAILMSQGIMATTYSLLTDYELGAKKVLPMKAHLAIDIMSGAFLMAAPWIFKFKKKSQIPFLAIGLLEITAALLTRDNPEK